MNKYLNKVKKLLNKEKSLGTVYTGLYHTWDDAHKNSSQQQGYADRRYDKRSLRKFTTDEKYTSGRNMIVPIVLGTLDQTKKIILDIGGGVNSVFSHLSDIQKNTGHCYIMERQEVVDEFNAKIPKQYAEHLTYISDIEELPSNRLDIIYFGSSIQYIPEYKELLNTLNQLNPTLIIFSESIFSTFSEDVWVLQQNMKPNIFPNLFLSEARFLDFMENLGYSCTLNITIPAEHSHDQIDRDQYECKTLIFKTSNAL